MFRLKQKTFTACFARPATDKEMKLFKDNCLNDLTHDWGGKVENIPSNLYNRMIESLKDETSTWWKSGYGTTFFKNSDNFKMEKLLCVDEKPYLKLSGQYQNRLYPEYNIYNEVFKTNKRCNVNIHSKFELLQFLGLEYFKISIKNRKLISNFFKENKDGIIYFV